MDIKKSVDRIKALSKDRGFKMKHLCTKLGVRENYFNDCKNKNLTIPDNLISTLAIMLETTVEYLKGETDDPMFHLSSIGMKTIPYESKGTRPVYGHTSAGLGVLAEQDVLGHEAVSPEHDSEEFFWLEVDGDSMSPVINDKDLVLVQKEMPLENGSIMVVLVDDTDGFIKKIAIDDDTVTLHSFNPYYPPMVFGGSDLGRLRFMGKVVEMKRKF